MNRYSYQSASTTNPPPPLAVPTPFSPHQIADSRPLGENFRPPVGGSVGGAVRVKLVPCRLTKFESERTFRVLPLRIIAIGQCGGVTAN
jgi:hypothetical protein